MSCMDVPWSVQELPVSQRTGAVCEPPALRDSRRTPPTPEKGVGYLCVFCTVSRLAAGAPPSRQRYTATTVAAPAMHEQSRRNKLLPELGDANRLPSMHVVRRIAGISECQIYNALVYPPGKFAPVTRALLRRQTRTPDSRHLVGIEFDEEGGRSSEFLKPSISGTSIDEHSPFRLVSAKNFRVSGPESIERS